MPSVTDKIHDILLPIAESSQAFIVDIIVRGERTSKVIEVYVDSDTGITLDACTEISRQLSERMDEADLFPGRYRMDVSSPGLDRPLKLLRQYPRNIGRRCKVRYMDGGTKAVIEGTLEQVTDTVVTVSKGNKSIPIPFPDILETYIIPFIK
ncbi:MAG: ribosome maturation factor RimP [Bacteroidetes bacterium]|nr:ribosome maturation factor RimP [Bacteroidota bacterium]